MVFVDSHSHLYLPQFETDRDEAVQRALASGVHSIFLPNIDGSTIDDMFSLCNAFPENCFPMMGLHPTSVKKDFEKELALVDHWLNKKKFIAVGECGIDLYWDKTFIEEQKLAFAHQIKLAVKHDLPLVIHARESFSEIYEVLEKNWDDRLTGVFHSFTGNMDDVQRINNFGFMFGLNGIVTFKNTNLRDIVKHIDITKILIETDSPYLAPAPFRGKRNESAYVVEVAKKLCEVYNTDLELVADITSKNALRLFKLTKTAN